MNLAEGKLLNEDVLRVIAVSDFYEKYIDKMYYIPQRDVDEDIEVFYIAKPEIAASYEEFTNFSSMINHAINPKGIKGYCFIHINPVRSYDEIEAEGRESEVVLYAP